MKKKYWIVFIALLAWCSYLTFEINTIHRRQKDNIIQNVNQYTINGYTTDLTNIVEKSNPKVVGVTGFTADWESAFGSGVVYSSESDGVYIATNYHIIDRVDEIRVLFHNGAEYPATLVGADSITDLALLKVEPEFEVEPFNLGDSSILKKGEYVIGIGNPIHEEFFGTVTFGIISGKDRSFVLDTNNDGTEDWDLRFLQTDAAINPGNSGGALINMNGDLVGITTMRVATADTEGMNFAIGINEATPILEQLKENGEIQRSLLGIKGDSISEMTTYQKNYQGIPLDLLQGVKVSKVLSDSAAKEMNLLVGDIIQSINGIEIKNVQDLHLFLYQNTSGTPIELVILRNNSEVIIQGVLQ